MNGMATREQLEDLWRSLLRHMRDKLAGPKVSAEFLAVARMFLAQNNYISPRIHEPATQRQLDRLDQLYVQGLLAGLSAPNPSAGILAEYRHWSERTKRQQGQQRAEQGPDSITMDVPFRTQ